MSLTNIIEDFQEKVINKEVFGNTQKLMKDLNETHKSNSKILDELTGNLNNLISRKVNKFKEELT